VDARGGAATTLANSGGQGGLISLSAGDGDNLTIGTGGLLASGGAGFGGDPQGDGGNIHVNPLTPTPGAVVLDGPLTTNVGDVFVRGSSVVQAASAPISTSGAGNVTISAETLATVLNATVSAGYGAVQIGANTDIDINAAITSAGGDVLVSANGNITSTSAGTITIAPPTPNRPDAMPATRPIAPTSTHVIASPPC